MFFLCNSLVIFYIVNIYITIFLIYDIVFEFFFVAPSMRDH